MPCLDPITIVRPLEAGPFGLQPSDNWVSQCEFEMCTD
jgi:hypothetical protein